MLKCILPAFRSDKENEGEEGGGERPATEDLEENREEAGEVEHEESQEKSEDDEDDEEDVRICLV